MATNEMTSAGERREDRAVKGRGRSPRLPTPWAGSSAGVDRGRTDAVCRRAGARASADSDGEQRQGGVVGLDLVDAGLLPVSLRVGRARRP